MRPRLVALIAAIGSTLFVADARAQPCGDTEKGHEMTQDGTQRRVWVNVETSRSRGGFCFFVGAVQSEGWVNESPHAGPAPVRQEGNDVIAALSFTQDVPYYGSWQSYGKHWHIYPAHGPYYDLGQTQKSTDVTNPGGGGGGGEECDPDIEQGCNEQCGLWDEASCTCEYTGGCGESPIVIDMAGNGYRLTNADDGVLFDLNGDGTPSQTAWTRPDSDDAWLAMDRNGNGVIDDGTELFGDHTPAYPDSRQPRCMNGFDALFHLESPDYGGGVADRIIDSREAAWTRLLLWTDRNHNGFSEPEELQPISGTALKAIDTRYTLSRRRDRHGNEFRQRGKGYWATSQGQLRARFIYDVWLVQQ